MSDGAMQALNLSRPPPIQTEIVYRGTYLSSLRLVLVSRAFPIAAPAGSPRELYRRLQEGKGTVLMSHKYSNCLVPPLDKQKSGIRAPT